jgi:putative ABC transport system substrate-binding protein
MRRREFLALTGSAAAAWPFAAVAQQAIPVVGFLSGRPPDEAAHLVSAYRDGLNDVSYSEGDPVAVGLFINLSHHEGNVIGISWFSSQLTVS